MMNRCLYCYQPLSEKGDFHESCSMSFFGTLKPPKIDYSLSEMNELAKTVVQRSIAIPGVQPKLSMELDTSNQEDTKARLTIVGALNGQYILKPPSARFKEMPANEHVTMRIAESFKIPVVPSTLIRLASGELAYLTKRIDRRENGAKVHMLDMYQITDAYDKYKGSMEKIGKAIDRHSSNPMLDKTYFLDLAIFIFLTGNNDMHLKNFSMIKTKYDWVIAPAYDLLNVSIVFPEDKEELALTLDGKKKKLKRAHFWKLGHELGLTEKQIQGSFKRMIQFKSFAFKWLNQSFLSFALKQEYKKLLEMRYSEIMRQNQYKVW